MSDKKHYDVILTELIKNIPVSTCVMDESVWFIPHRGTFAIAIPKTVQFFDLSHTQNFKNSEIFKFPSNTHELLPSGKMENEGGRIIHELKAKAFTSWVDEKLLKLFPDKQYRYHAEYKLAYIFCENKKTKTVDGLILPVRKKEGYGG